MSRRTKLISLTALVVLLAIPVGYVAMTLRPVRPLTFRIERMAPISEGYLNGHYRAMDVRVTNTSPIAITFYGGRLADPTGLLKYELEDKGGVAAQELPQGRYWVRSFPQLIIPAHSDVLVPGGVLTEWEQAAQKGDLVVHYDYESRTWSMVRQSSVWMSQHSPQWVRRFITSRRPLVEAAALEPIDSTSPSAVSTP